MATDRTAHSALTHSSHRIAAGFGWGVVATIAMSILMIIGVRTGIAPMPKPIPAAIVGKLLGGGPKALVMILAIVSHIAYGGFWGAVLARFASPVTIGKGLGLGVILWLIMQLVVLPFLGWGLFGSAVTLKIAGATLLLHLVYGAVLGALIDRK